MVIPTSSKAMSTRLGERSLGQALTSIRLKIELMNPRKEEEKIIERTKKIKKVCNVITMKSEVT